MTEHVYATNDTATVAVYRETVAAFNEMGRKAGEDAEALGKNKGALIRNHRVSAPEVVGLGADDPTDPPAGWRYSKAEECLVPRRGQAGEPARQWLDAHQPPDLRAVLEQHGLPRTCKPGEDFRFFLSTPGVFEHDGTVWALYPAAPDGECAWTPRKLSEWHAAREAAEEAQSAAGKQVAEVAA